VVAHGKRRRCIATAVVLSGRDHVPVCALPGLAPTFGVSRKHLLNALSQRESARSLF